jgi:hypothetical protein
VNVLAAEEYDALSVRERLDALLWLLHTLLDGPTLRAVLDARAEDVATIKKQMVEDAKVRDALVCCLFRAGGELCTSRVCTLCVHYRWFMTASGCWCWDCGYCPLPAPRRCSWTSGGVRRKPL